jgi:hypothetical protein
MIASYTGPIMASVCSILISVGNTPAFESGVIATFLELHTNSSNKNETLYLPYMSKTQIIPTIGQMCYITYHISDLNGIIGSESKKLLKVNMIDKIQCH